MSLEWDPRKAGVNLRKHGIDFADAATVLHDECAITVGDTVSGEDRFVTVGGRLARAGLGGRLHVSERAGAVDLGSKGDSPGTRTVRGGTMRREYLVAETLGPRVYDAQLAVLGYVAADGHWWVASPREDLAGPFALAAGTHRGDGAATQIVYDADWLSPVSSTDALGLTTELAIDPITLQPATTTDPNGAVTEVVHDRFGRIVATGIVGHIGTEPWSSGTTAGWQLPAAPGVAQILTDPMSWLGGAATATWIDDRAWERDGTPVAEISLQTINCSIGQGSVARQGQR